MQELSDMLIRKDRARITQTFTSLIRFARKNVCDPSINNGEYDKYVTPSLNVIEKFVASENESLRLFHVIWMLFSWDAYPFGMTLADVSDFYGTVFERDIGPAETEALETFRKAIFNDTQRLALLHCDQNPDTNVEIWKQHLRTVVYVPPKASSSD